MTFFLSPLIPFWKILKRISFNIRMMNSEIWREKRFHNWIGAKIVNMRILFENSSKTKLRIFYYLLSTQNYEKLLFIFTFWKIDHGTENKLIRGSSSKKKKIIRGILMFEIVICAHV